MKISITAKQRTLSIVCFVLFLLACNLGPAVTSTSMPIVAATPIPTDTPAPNAILPPDATATINVPLVETAPADPCVAAPAGLAGWWPGNDDARDVVAGNDGRLNGGVDFVAGKVGQAFNFNGINGSVEVPRGTGLDLRRQVTIEFWMQPAPDNGMDDCCQGLVGTEYYLVEISGGWSKVIGVNVALNNGNIYKQTSDQDNAAFKVPAGEWSFIVGTYDGQRLRLYVNGQEVQSLDHRGKIAPMFSNSLSIGSEDGRTDCDHCTSTRYFKGLIDEVSIYDRALTAGEVWSIFAAGEAGKCILSP